MTHKDIYTKFMIEYDKANVTSSYPSLTEYEVATVLDKAYNALIAQKVTGNNVRRIALEGDLKSIEDISPLIKTVLVNSSKIKDASEISSNVEKIKLQDDHLYFIDCNLTKPVNQQFMQNIQVSGQAYPIPDEVKNNFNNKDYYVRYIESKYGVNAVDTEYGVKLTVYYKETGGTNSAQSDVITQSQSVSEYLKSLAEQHHFDPLFEITSISAEPYSSVEGGAYQQRTQPEGVVKLYADKGTPMDLINDRNVNVQLVNHAIATKFYSNSHNLPWVKIPVGYIEDGWLYVVYDPIEIPYFDSANITYIKTPHLFAKKWEDMVPDGFDITDFCSSVSYFNPVLLESHPDLDDNPTQAEIDAYNAKWNDPTNEVDFSGIQFSIMQQYWFECNDTVAEELISLAVAFALENVESQRLNSKLNMRGLEA